MKVVVAVVVGLLTAVSVRLALEVMPRGTGDSAAMKWVAKEIVRRADARA